MILNEGIDSFYSCGAIFQQQALLYLYEFAVPFCFPPICCFRQFQSLACYSILFSSKFPFFSILITRLHLLFSSKLLPPQVAFQFCILPFILFLSRVTVPVCSPQRYCFQIAGKVFLPPGGCFILFQPLCIFFLVFSSIYCFFFFTSRQLFYSVFLQVAVSSILTLKFMLFSFLLWAAALF